MKRSRVCICQLLVTYLFTLSIWIQLYNFLTRMQRLPGGSELPLKADVGPDPELSRNSYWAELANAAEASSLGSVVDTANEFGKARVRTFGNLPLAFVKFWAKFLFEAAGQAWFQVTQLELVLAYPDTAGKLAISTMVISILSSVASMCMTTPGLYEYAKAESRKLGLHESWRLGPCCECLLVMGCLVGGAVYILVTLARLSAAAFPCPTHSSFSIFGMQCAAW